MYLSRFPLISTKHVQVSVCQPSLHSGLLGLKERNVMKTLSVAQHLIPVLSTADCNALM